MTSLQDIRAAATVAAAYTIRTPQRDSPALSQRLGCRVSLKLEMNQHSGSFKTRGAFHQMLALGEAALGRGVVAVSGGNFARAVAYCSGVLGVDALICMPENAPAGSIAATRDYGAKVELLPDAVAAFARADELAAAGRSALHPFDNREQIAGNGSVALEIMQDCPGLTDIIVSIGGGGLIAGVIAAVKAQKPSVRVWGVEPIEAPTMQRALAAGEIVHIVPRSLSATLGGPFVGQTALDLCQAHLEDLILVSDLEMIAAQQWFIQREDLRPELAATSTLAAALRIKERLPADAQLTLLICGCNDSDADIARYAELLAAS
ncbi:MAG: pyridoxal-phosphate dependent enzyme [Chloroflexi bacterium]|nr:pyridoxal-phosphate dependent enzyme [Chloroflexota bacterium]MCY3582140.1 pyridoxal-phosphate dependent enzyme [Chloroflexota bacterium]MCY3716613.1 pyridoxal-phosphate dependent enzyme [Chloroflexota bacterium]MDE2650987.1 pyridoxal-phosphate dependent enzyme [Chloroflexota bacterium]MXV93189.1 pyridoxal-phosphate dependent enzyme [Chloroflexota bacterium]